MRGSSLFFDAEKRGYILLLFPGLPDYFLHAQIGQNLIVCPESKAFMQRIGQIGSCVCRKIAHLFTWPVHHHAPKRLDDLFAGVPFPHLFLKKPEDGQRGKTRDEVCFDAVLFLKEDRACSELRLHDPKALLDLPAPLVDSNDFVYRDIAKVGADGIKAIILFLVGDHIPVDIGYFPGAGLAVLCHDILGNEPMRVILVFLSLLVPARSNKLVCPVDLSLPDLSQIVPVLEGEGHH